MGREQRLELRKYAAYFLRGLLWLIFACCLYALNQQDNVKEAILRSQVKLSSTGVIFVAFNGRDPGESFIQRFKKDEMLVRKASQGMEKNDQGWDVWKTYYVDTATGLKGGYINIRYVLWFGPFWTRVKVDYPMAGYTFTVVRTWKGWVVVKKDMNWIA